MEKEIIYNKLVRDKVLDVIKNDNKRYEYHIADDNEYRNELIKKVIEELKEFKSTPNEEEMADIYEVLEALSKLFSLDKDKIQKEKENKLLKRGSFDKRIILEKVYEKDSI